MDIRRFAPLRAAGATWTEIAAEAGCDWRTARKYLSPDAPVGPPRAPSRAGTQPRLVDPFVEVIDTWLQTEPRLRASVIHERLVADYGFTGHYQRIKNYVRDARVRLELAADPSERPPALHRRFEVTAGAQAQVDWGDEGMIETPAGRRKVYSFHMTLSYSRDPFVCFTHAQDLATFFDCHRRAFAHFGGVPATIVYDRTKTVVRRHVAPRQAVPLHPQVAAFAQHYGFSIDVLAAYRPTGKGRVERQVLIAREHVLAGREFTSLVELDAAFERWVPIRRAQTHRTHGEVIGLRAARDHAALATVPARPLLVSESHLRRVGRDSMISFEGSSYSVAARADDGRATKAGQRVEVRLEATELVIRRLPLDSPNGTAIELGRHPRAGQRGQRVVDPAHWAELPDGHTRATTVEATHATSDAAAAPEVPEPAPTVRTEAMAGLAVKVVHRPLTDYDALAGLAPPQHTAERDQSLVGAA
ncbi:IS21 family transposase [Actinomycetospora lemnae]|uniref:IS21 family transposase n=1 Tax=Actinomycetospora lemnae TaxID=3019891 RepID=A0ABT5SUV2_9PSEU|nr:IS21 family transposase [Actinomycetospora sp. DW7H6]MDD7965523.1 IS21 family transposase [Actinomycetospora sp. DW7H6]